MYSESFNKNNYNRTIPNKKVINRDYFNESDYDDEDGFIDDTGCTKMDKGVLDFVMGVENYKKKRKANEIEGDIMETNYEMIQAEEAHTRRIARKEDAEELQKLRELNEEEEDEDEDDY